MNKGLLAFFGALFLAGCSSSSDYSSEVKLVVIDGYAAYRIDDSSWTEIRDELEIPEATSFDTISLVDVCILDDIYSYTNIFVLKPDTLKTWANSHGKFEMGCGTPYQEPTKSPHGFTLASSNPDMFFRHAQLSEEIWYPRDGYNQDREITISTNNDNGSGNLFVIGKNEKSEYFMHFNSDFSFLSNNTYTIDFYDSNSTKAISGKNLDSDDYEYWRDLVLNDDRILLSPDFLSDIYLRPESEDFFPPESVYREFWSSKDMFYSSAPKFSAQINSREITNKNPLLNKAEYFGQLSVIYKNDNSTYIDASPILNRFKEFTNLEVISYLFSNSGTIKYTNKASTSTSLSIQSPTVFYELPNFPEKAKLDMNTVGDRVVTLEFDNGLDEQEVGYESYGIVKSSFF